MAKKIVSLVLAMTMVLSLFSTLSFAADETFTIVDMNKKSVITGAGAKASSKETKDAKYSAQWDMDKLNDLIFKDIEHDMSQYSKISFNIKLDSTGPATIMFALHSENDGTDGIDYYSKELTLTPGDWTTVELNYSDLMKNREPKGYDDIDNITLHGVGWNNKHEAGAVAYVDSIVLSGEPTDITGGGNTEPSGNDNDKPTGGKTFTEDDTEVGEKIFYNSKASGMDGLGSNEKTNKIEGGKDDDGANYIYFETLDNASDYHLDKTISGATRFMVIQMKLAYEKNCVSGNVQYKDSSNTTAELMKIDKGVLSAGGKEIAKLNSKGEYTDIAFAIDWVDNSADVYVDGELVEEGLIFASPDRDAISSLRIYVGSGNAVGSNLLVKDYLVYEGTEPREIADDDLGPRVSVVAQDNSAAIKTLGDNVALALGGNGIYYNREKHDIDAPAFETGDRTLVPVRAISEAFGLQVDWDEATGTVTIDGKSKIVIGSTEMVLPDGSTYTLDVPAETYNDRTFLPLRALCEQILGKVVTWDDHGLIVIGDAEFTTSESALVEAFNYLLYDRPMADELVQIFNEQNQNQHPRVMMNKEIYDRVVYNYANDETVKEWGDDIIRQADNYLNAAMPTYSIPDGYRLLETSRDVYGRSKVLSMAYILTKDKKYSDNLYQVFTAAGNFPDWNQQHFLDIGEMTCAFAIGYDWLYDVWTDEQRAFLEDKIYNYGLVVADKAYYNQLGGDGWWTPGNETNWNVVCNGGILMGATAIFDKYPEFCANLIQLEVRDVEAMMNSFYPAGAWFEGIGYWSYTLDYTVNMFSTLQACFGTDFNLTKAPGFDRTVYFSMAGDGPTSINNYHDAGEGHQNSSTYFWLSNQFDIPGVTNVRLFNMEELGWSPSPFDLLWYNTDIKGTDFELEKDTYLPEVEFVAMRNSWVDNEGAWLSFHAGQANVNHSHLDTGSFVVDLLGERWAVDLGGDDYNMDGYFGNNKHKYYRLRPEGHNLYVINPSEYEGQDVNSFCKVENGVVSKPRGAYAIADLTPAYARDASSARRGYMLADDRRSALIRDEITFKSGENDFYWFSHISSGTEAEIVDNNTVILTKNGKQVKVLIDTNLPDYELSIMDAVPLPSSPVMPAQNKNEGIHKIAIHSPKASGSVYVQVKFIPVDDVNADKPLENVALDDWTIPDGDFVPAPVAPTLTDLAKNGETVAAFSPKQTGYTVSVPYGTTEVPVITAAAETDCDVVIEQSQSFDTPTIVYVSRKDEPDVVRKYTIGYTVLPKLEDVNGWKRLQVSGHSASDEPEAAHPATQVSNNDTSAESRWAAEGTQWVQIDLGSVQSVSAIGLSWWKGNERAYSFDIEVSTDGVNFEPVLTEKSSDGKTEGYEIFELDKAYEVRYIRYVGYGNSANNWNSVTEFAALTK